MYLKVHIDGAPTTLISEYWTFRIKPSHDKTPKMACATNDDPEKHGYIFWLEYLLYG